MPEGVVNCVFEILVSHFNVLQSTMQQGTQMMKNIMMCCVILYNNLRISVQGPGTRRKHDNSPSVNSILI